MDFRQALGGKSLLGGRSLGSGLWGQVWRMRKNGPGGGALVFTWLLSTRSPARVALCGFAFPGTVGMKGRGSSVCGHGGSFKRESPQAARKAPGSGAVNLVGCRSGWRLFWMGILPCSWFKSQQHPRLCGRQRHQAPGLNRCRPKRTCAFASR